MRIPIGLVPAPGKSATESSKQIKDIIRRYSVTTLDVFSAINDTTNSSVKVGEMVSGKRGSCGMHAVDLSMEHATGQAKQSRAKKIVDRFDECKLLRIKLKNCFSWLMSHCAKKGSRNIPVLTRTLPRFW